MLLKYLIKKLEKINKKFLKLINKIEIKIYRGDIKLEKNIEFEQVLKLMGNGKIIINQGSKFGYKYGGGV